MYSKYCNGWDVNSKYDKEFITLWPGWLGLENAYKLDIVSQEEWARFNDLIRALSKQFIFKLVDRQHEIIHDIQNIETTLDTYETSMNKSGSLFTLYLLPELDCLIEEHWDYTYIIWHRHNGAIDKLTDFIKKAKLYHFHN